MAHLLVQGTLTLLLSGYGYPERTNGTPKERVKERIKNLLDNALSLFYIYTNLFLSQFFEMIMKKIISLVFLVFLVIVDLNPNSSFAQYRYERFRKDLKDELSWGFSERIRWVWFDNALDLNKKEDDKKHFFRFRTSLWGESKLWKGCKLFLKFTNEFRRYFKPRVEFSWDEIFVDNLYLEWKQISGTPWSIKIGRQDLTYGDGLVLMDGGPLDESRSIYFNSVKLTWGDSILGLDFIGIYNTKKDRSLPLINNKNKKLLEEDEKSWGIFYKREYSKEQRFEAYYIWKREKTKKDSYTNTYGAMTTGLLAKDFTYTGELAYQTGKIGEQNRKAYGGEFNLTKSFKSKYSPKLKSGYIYLSGDDKDTKRFEGWNPLFSRWPKWSELYIYTLIKENEDRIAYWTNLKSFWFGFSFVFSNKLFLDFKYYNLSVNEKTDYKEDSFISSGEKRGDLFELKLNLKLNDKISGHLLWEHFKPGSYYFNGADDADFLRCEFFYNFSSR